MCNCIHDVTSFVNRFINKTLGAQAIRLYYNNTIMTRTRRTVETDDCVHATNTCAFLKRIPANVFNYSFLLPFSHKTQDAFFAGVYCTRVKSRRAVRTYTYTVLADDYTIIYRPNIIHIYIHTQIRSIAYRILSARRTYKRPNDDDNIYYIIPNRHGRGPENASRRTCGTCSSGKTRADAQRFRAADTEVYADHANNTSYTM